MAATLLAFPPEDYRTVIREAAMDLLDKASGKFGMGNGFAGCQIQPGKNWNQDKVLHYLRAWASRLQGLLENHIDNDRTLRELEVTVNGGWNRIDKAYDFNIHWTLHVGDPFDNVLQSEFDDEEVEAAWENDVSVDSE